MDTQFVPETEGGVYGACGPKENSNSMIVALNHKQYGNMNKKSKWCGKKIRISGPKGSVTAKINDACPGMMMVKDVYLETWINPSNCIQDASMEIQT